MAEDFDNTPAGIRLRLAREYGGPVDNTSGLPGDSIFWALNEYHKEMESKGYYRDYPIRHLGGQSRLRSLQEVVTNTSLGFAGSWAITYALVNSDLDKLSVVNLTTLLCTLWSLVRGWGVRRTFNRRG